MSSKCRVLKDVAENLKKTQILNQTITTISTNPLKTFAKHHLLSDETYGGARRIQISKLKSNKQITGHTSLQNHEGLRRFPRK